MAEQGAVFRPVVHPFDEFKEAGTSTKWLIVIGGIAVVAIILYVHGGLPAIGGSSTSSGTSGDGSSSGGWQTVPAPNTGVVPILPSNVNPLYDPSGNLVGYKASTLPQGGGPFGRDTVSTSGARIGKPGLRNQGNTYKFNTTAITKHSYIRHMRRGIS